MYILLEFLRNLAVIGDKESQKRIWIENRGPECQAFDDAVCDFLDAGYFILREYKSFNIKGGQRSILKEFISQFQKFSHENDLPQLFIDTPEWTRITEMAQEVLDAFDYKKPV